MKDDEWTVGVDGKTWEEKFDFAWNPRFSADGKAIAVQIKQGMDYSLAINGKPWEKKFASIREFALSPNGQTVIAAVQVEPLKEGDTDEVLRRGLGRGGERPGSEWEISQCVGPWSDGRRRNGGRGADRNHGVLGDAKRDRLA